MPLARLSEPFSHRDWVFEIKWDGFRALLYSDKHGVGLISRNGNEFKSFPGLCEGLDRDLQGRRCVLDGEIVCLDSWGQTQFRDLLFRRAEPYFYAFDILWDKHAWSDDEQERYRFRKGEDVRYLPLIDRKLRLRAVRRPRMQHKGAATPKAQFAPPITYLDLSALRSHSHAPHNNAHRIGHTTVSVVQARVPLSL